MIYSAKKERNTMQIFLIFYFSNFLIFYFSNFLIFFSNFLFFAFHNFWKLVLRFWYFFKFSAMDYFSFLTFFQSVAKGWCFEDVDFQKSNMENELTKG